ncbi:extracellular solute-binding protein [candidate division KSB1 bacterium]|nr:extracellular solute-binding protein [candidate division KSB1 bacterium]
MDVLHWIWIWLRRNYFFVFALVLLALGFFIWIGLNPKMHRRDFKIEQLYFADNISPAHARLVDEFNALNRGRIEVVPVNLPFQKFSTNERKELLTRALRSKSNKLDVFAVDLIWVDRFAKWAEPLDAYFQQEERDQLLEYAITSCLYDNQLVGLPLYIDIGILFYRRDILNKLPDAEQLEKRLQTSMTWEEFIALGRRMAHLNLPFYLFPAEPYEGLMCSFIENLASQHQPAANGETINLSTPAAYQALKLMVDLVNKYRLSPMIITRFKEVDLYVYALDQDALFFRGWPGNLEIYRADYPDKVKNIGVAAMPHFKDGRPTAVFGGWNLMVSKYSTKKHQAIEFLKFVSTQHSQKILYEVMGYLPTNKLVYEDSALCKKYPDLKYLRSLLAHGVHRPAAADYTRISDIITYSLHLAIKNGTSVEEALALAQQRITSHYKP